MAVPQEHAAMDEEIDFAAEDAEVDAMLGIEFL